MIQQLIHRAAAPFAIALLIAALTACGGSGGGGNAGDGGGVAVTAPDPLDVYRQQTVAWKNCDAIPEALDPSVVERTQCAAVRVPRDYLDPTGAVIEIGLMRVKAIPSETKPEPLFFNPGGPGGEGYTDGAMFAHLTTAEGWNPDHPYYQVHQRFDFIGFDPRGVGVSTPLECTSDTLLEAVDQSVSGRTAENIAAQVRNTETISQACARNPLTRHIHTDATARDMDLLREILGAEKLHFYGASYGTWLGLWYAGLFPERVGKMVLDSTADFTTYLQDIAFTQGPAMARAFNDILAPYAARHPDVFELGDDVESIRNAIAQLHPVVRAAVARKIYDAMFSSESAPTVFNYLLAGQRLSLPPFLNLWPQALSHADFSALQLQLKAEAFSADEERDDELRGHAREIVQEIESKRRPRAVSHKEVDPVYTAVVCNDSWSRNAGLAWWIDQETRMLTDFPIFGTADLRSCAGWSAPPQVVKPPMLAMKDLDILLLQSEFDAATPAEGALNTFSQLPQAHLVMVRGAMTHGVLHSNVCADRHFLRYLLGATPAQRTSECKAAPLAEDALDG